jgi:hypothetical protein
MRRLTREDILNAPRPKCDPISLIDYCLDRMIEDQKKYITWDCVKGLTYQDLVSTLLKSRDIIEKVKA